LFFWIKNINNKQKNKTDRANQKFSNTVKINVNIEKNITNIIIGNLVKVLERISGYIINALLKTNR
jgi:hypothetical protein